MERTNLQYVGFVRVLSISQGLTIVKDVPIKKVNFTECQITPVWFEIREQVELLILFCLTKRRVRCDLIAIFNY